jgi:hypothetical protein
VPVCGCPDGLSWKDSLDLPGLDSLSLLREYFLSLPRHIYDSRIPAQELLVSSDAPMEKQEKDGRIDIMRDSLTFTSSNTDEDSSWVIAHSGMGYGFALNLTQPFGNEARPRRVKMEWLDPRTGTKQVEREIDIGRAVKFEPPSKGSVKDDWVLILSCILG